MYTEIRSCCLSEGKEVRTYVFSTLMCTIPSARTNTSFRTKTGQIYPRKRCVVMICRTIERSNHHIQAGGPSEERTMSGSGADTCPGPGTQEFLRLHRLDFPGVQIQRESNNGQRSSPALLVREGSVIERPLFFPEPFETTLPYRMVWRSEDKKYSGVMLDEERIIGLAVSDVCP